MKEPQDRPGTGVEGGAAALPLRSEPRTLELIQVFRGMAALMVMLFHVTMTNHFYSPYLGNVFGCGHSGVDFFFVLSGFVMLYAHYEQAGDVRRLWRFLALRAVRIYPIYWIVLAVTVAAFWLHPPTPENVWAPVSTLDPYVLRSAVLLTDPEFPIVPIAWTMTYELVFYAFFALYFVLGARLFALVTVGWAAALAAQWTRIAYWPYPILMNPLVGEFFLGCLAAFLVKRLDLKRVSVWWVILAVAAFAVVARAELVSAIDGHAGWYAAPYFFLIWAGAAYDQAGRRSYPRLLVLIGEASYSIYLIHYGLIAVFAETVDYYRPTASLYPNLTLTMVAIAIVMIGLVVHTCIERPILRAFRRRLR